MPKSAEEDRYNEEQNPGTSSQPERLFGRAKVQVNVKLGQLCKTAMYEEAVEELQGRFLGQMLNTKSL